MRYEDARIGQLVYWKGVRGKITHLWNEDQTAEIECGPGRDDWYSVMTEDLIPIGDDMPDMGPKISVSYAENDTLSANILICNNLPMVLWVLRNDKGLNVLIAWLRDTDRYAPVGRIAKLLDDRGEAGYAHKHDHSIAVLLYILSQINDRWMAIMARAVLDNGQGLRWSKDMAEWCLSIAHV